MKKFDPASLLVPRASAADEGAIIRMAQKSRNLRANGHDVVSLTVGEPDFDTPDNIQQAATRAMKAGFTHYSPVAGIPELRAVVAKKLKTENNLDYSSAEIVLTNGAKQAIANAVLSIIDVGDEVIMLAPFWVSYETTVLFAGGTPVVLHSDISEGYKVPASRIAAAVTPRTKLLILNSPCNPSGAVWSSTELEAIAAILRDHPHMMVLSDEIYSRLLFDGAQHFSIMSVPGMQERTILLDGFSKTYAMTGWRMGYGVMRADLATHMTRLMTNSNSCTASFTQIAGIEAINGDQSSVNGMRDEFQRRRDMFVAGLNKVRGFSCRMPKGAFYVFPNIKQSGWKSKPLADALLEQAGVAALSGTAFGEFGEGYLRFSVANSLANLQQALERIDQWSNKNL